MGHWKRFDMEQKEQPPEPDDISPEAEAELDRQFEEMEKMAVDADYDTADKER